MRVALGVAAWMVIAASAFFIFQIEQTLDERLDALRAFDAQARAAVDRLTEVRASQLSYVAEGQDASFWMPKVAGLAESSGQTLDHLRSTASSAEGRSALMAAAAAVTEFGNVDRRARSYLRTAQPLMAADVVFSEGATTAMTAAQNVETARQAEHTAFDRFEGTRRRQQAYTAAAAAGLAALTLAFLAFAAPASTAAGETVTDGSAAAAPSSSSELSLRAALPATAAKPIIGRHELLREAADICTEFSRISDEGELAKLLARAAVAMDASGIVVWIGDTAGGDLRPVMAHGYPPQTLARMASVPRSAGNATASAYRGAQMQIVRARPGASSGAIVAPLLSQAGCVGAFTAEINGGGEESDAIQSLAAIFAAQLANVVAAPGGVESEAIETDAISQPRSASA
jgi:hypothetical protein